MKRFTITVKCNCSHEFTVQCGFADEGGNAPVRCDKCNSSLLVQYTGETTRVLRCDISKPVEQMIVIESFTEKKLLDN